MKSFTSPLKKIGIALALIIGFTTYSLSAQTFSADNAPTQADGKQFRSDLIRNSNGLIRMSVIPQWGEDGFQVMDVYYDIPQEVTLTIVVTDWLGNVVWQDHAFFTPGSAHFRITIDDLQGYDPGKIMSYEASTGHSETIFLGKI